MHEMLLACGANGKIVTQEWTANHYRWIVWKLAAMERSFPCQLGNKYLTPQRVFSQLMYRYINVCSLYLGLLCF